MENFTTTESALDKVSKNSPLRFVIVALPCCTHVTDASSTGFSSASVTLPDNTKSCAPATATQQNNNIIRYSLFKSDKAN